jgi:DEAD/DEAH box helicase
MSSKDESAAERKRKRLEEWKKRQQKRSSPAQPPPPATKVSLKIIAKKKKKPAANSTVGTLFGAVDDDDDDGEGSYENGSRDKRNKNVLGLGFSLDETELTSVSDEPVKRRKKARWDAGPPSEPLPSPDVNDVVDALDSFMDKLDAGALGKVVTQTKEADGTAGLLSIDVGGSMMRASKQLEEQHAAPGNFSSGVITSEEVARLTSSNHKSLVTTPLSKAKLANPEALYTASDWETSGGEEPDTEDEEEEEKARRALIEALKTTTGPPGSVDENQEEIKKPSLAVEVKNEKLRKEKMLRDLEREAEKARNQAERSEAPELGRLYNDSEGGIMEEAERNLDAAMAAPDALQVLAEINKKKELKSVDHSTVEYIPFRKNLYIVPRSLATLTNDEVVDLRSKLKIKVRGHGAPAPISTFQMSGLSERILQILEKQGITEPFPIQAQCLPCIMAGRDTIGIAKTGSGKTLSFLLPLLRHILDQPPLGPSESGPIGLILAPARELAYQIYLVCKSFTKPLGLK